MAPPQQLDPIALAWLQLLQSQATAQHDPGVGSSSRVQADVQGHPEQPPTQPTHLPDDPANPEDENDSEGELAATAEDKRRRNTAASGNFSVALPFEAITDLARSPIPEQEEAVAIEYGKNRHKPIPPGQRVGTRGGRLATGERMVEGDRDAEDTKVNQWGSAQLV